MSDIKKNICEFTRIAVVALGILLFSTQTQAQVKELETNEEVMVIAPFNPTLKKALRLQFNPQIDSAKTQKLPIEYITQPRLYETNFSVEKLTAAKFIDRKDISYAQNYITGGYGMYNTLYGEAFINKQWSKKTQLGLHVRHFSGNGGLSEMAYPGYAFTNATIWSKHLFTHYKVSLSGHYKRNAIHYYGFLPEDYPAELLQSGERLKSDIGQVYQLAGIEAEIQNAGSTKNHDWRLGVNYDYFRDDYGSTEQLFDLNGHYQSAVEWFDVEKQAIGIKINTQTYQTNFNYSGLFPTVDSTAGYFHGLYEFAPYFRLNQGDFNLMVGINLGLALDSNSAVGLAPVVKADMALLDEQLQIYALADGGFKNNSFSSLSSENGFVSPVFPLKYTNTKYHLQLGAKGHVANYIDYHIYGEMSSFDQLPMFVTDTNSRFDNSFMVIYDGGQQWGVGAEASFKTDRWNIDLSGKYQSFIMDTATRAWQKPSLLYQFKVGYYILENLNVTGLLLGQSKMYNLYQGEKVVEPFMDFSLHVNYHLTPNLGFFVKATNIFSDEYQLWYNYPVQSIGFMGGVHFAF